MKVITKCVLIKGKKFVLINDNQQGREFFGTIPYTELEGGRLKRALNGLEMCAADTANEAIARREYNLKFKEWKESHPDATAEDIVQFLLQSAY